MKSKEEKEKEATLITETPKEKWVRTYAAAYINLSHIVNCASAAINLWYEVEEALDNDGRE